MRLRSLLALAAALAAVPTSAAAQDPLTVYSSLPLQGASRPQTTDIVRGARLALERAGGQAAGRPVRYVSLSDATRRAGTWLPERAARNARRIARDVSAVAMIGAFNSGSSAISIPILNEAGVLQVSPSNTASGLTVDGFGSDRGEPARYYPTGDRTYGRLLPNDQVQARAAAVAIRDAGARRVLVVHDGEVYGRGLAKGVREAARARGLEVAGFRRLGRRGRNARSVARAARGADAVFYGGITANGAVRLWRALGRQRRLQLFAGDGVAETGFTRRIGRGVQRRTRVMVATLAPSEYPASGQEVLAALGGDPDPYALYGYEAMAVVLDAIERGGATRQGVVDAFFATRDRDSVLGPYSIDANGDISTTRYGRYRIERGALVFDGTVDAAAP